MLKKIILHWTAGVYIPNSVDLKSYHFLFGKNGELHKGVFNPENNVICKPNQYAAHTGGGNTKAIGLACCAMSGFKSPQHCGAYPLLRKQVEAMLSFSANLLKRYNISLNSQNVMTHYEFGQNNPNTTSFGKIDFYYLPYEPSLKPHESGEYLRSKIKWYLNK